MDRNRIATPAGIAAATAVLLGVVFALFLLLDLGPFSDEELTVEEFIAQGDEICERAHDEFLELQDRPPRTSSDAAELTGGLIDVAEEEHDAIAEAAPPADLGALVDRYLAAREQGIELLREGHAAADAADARAYEAARTELAATQAERFELAREIGFRECSKELRD